MKKATPALALLLYLVVYLTTQSPYIGDTVRYASNAVVHLRGGQAQFWEFGHLLWRPWAGLGYLALATTFAQWFGDDPEKAVVRFLVVTNFLCSGLIVYLLTRLLQKVASPWVAVAVTFSLICSDGFLSYSHSGTPYLPALLCSVTALLLLIAAIEQPAEGHRYSILGGLAFALTCALWFPYSFSGLGMPAVLLFWPSTDKAAPMGIRWNFVRTFLVTLAITSIVIFAAGAAAQGISDVGGLLRWIQEADNHMAQSKRALRAITGIPRSLWDFGREETVLLKRWLFKDPYNPVQIASLALSLGGKLAIFYLGLLAALWVTWKERRAQLLIFAAAALPLVAFAILLFEPSSAERYLPVFAFAFLAFAVALETFQRHPIASSCVAVLLAATSLFNLTQDNIFVDDARSAAVRQRIQGLRKSVVPGSLVTLMTFEDTLYRLPLNHPLDPSLSTSGFQLTDGIVLSADTTLLWKSIFAKKTFEEWAGGRESWFSERLVASRPEGSWLWVEGDDPSLHWADISAAFGQLKTDAKVDASGDGFLRVADDAANRELLTAWIRADQKTAGVGGREETHTAMGPLHIAFTLR